MNKTNMKKLFRSILNKEINIDEHLPLMLEVFNKYRVDYDYEPAKMITIQKDSYGINNQFKTEHGVLSYLKAVDNFFGKKENSIQKYKAAARRSLMQNMYYFRLNNLPELCPHTNIKLTIKNSHVDHVGEYEFDDIANRYINEIGIVNVKYKSTDMGDLFEDEFEAELFKTFHDEYAELEVVHSSHNLERSKQKGLHS